MSIEKKSKGILSFFKRKTEKQRTADKIRKNIKDIKMLEEENRKMANKLVVGKDGKLQTQPKENVQEQAPPGINPEDIAQQPIPQPIIQPGQQQAPPVQQVPEEFIQPEEVQQPMPQEQIPVVGVTIFFKGVQNSVINTDVPINAIISFKEQLNEAINNQSSFDVGSVVLDDTIELSEFTLNGRNVAFYKIG